MQREIYSNWLLEINYMTEKMLTKLLTTTKIFQQICLWWKLFFLLRNTIVYHAPADIVPICHLLLNKKKRISCKSEFSVGKISIDCTNMVVIGMFSFFKLPLVVVDRWSFFKGSFGTKICWVGFRVVVVDIWLFFGVQV